MISISYDIFTYIDTISLSKLAGPQFNHIEVGACLLGVDLKQYAHIVARYFIKLFSNPLWAGRILKSQFLNPLLKKPLAHALRQISSDTVRVVHHLHPDIQPDIHTGQVSLAARTGLPRVQRVPLPAPTFNEEIGFVLPLAQEVYKGLYVGQLPGPDLVEPGYWYRWGAF
jgi:hypothetical protein